MEVTVRLGWVPKVEFKLIEPSEVYKELLEITSVWKLDRLESVITEISELSGDVSIRLEDKLSRVASLKKPMFDESMNE